MNPLHKSLLKINAIKREQINILDNIDISSNILLNKYLLLEKNKIIFYKFIKNNYEYKYNNKKIDFINYIKN
jgi:hypothetical protein